MRRWKQLEGDSELKLYNSLTREKVRKKAYIKSFLNFSNQHEMWWNILSFFRIHLYLIQVNKYFGIVVDQLSMMLLIWAMQGIPLVLW